MICMSNWSSGFPTLTRPNLSRLPSITEAAEQVLVATNSDLATIPKEPDSQPATYVLELLSGLCDDVQRQVVGGFNVGTLVQKNKECYATFKYTIRKTAPNFIPFIKPSSPTSGTGTESDSMNNPKGIVHGQVDGRTEVEPYYLDEMRAHIKSSVFSFQLSLFSSFLTLY